MKDKIKAIVIFFILSLIILSTKIIAQTNLNDQQYTNTSIINITNNTNLSYYFNNWSYCILLFSINIYKTYIKRFIHLIIINIVIFLNFIKIYYMQNPEV